MKLRNDITNSIQDIGETLYKTWERFKDDLRRYLHHELPLWMQIQIFYNGMSGSDRVMVHVGSSDSIMCKPPEEVWELFEVMVSIGCQ